MNNVSLNQRDEVAFNVNNKLPVTNVLFGGNMVPVSIDTGASVNIISEQTYDKLKETPALLATEIRLFSYKSNNYLPLKEKFNTCVMYNNTSTVETFFVVKGNGDSLMCFETANKLGIINMLCNVTIGDIETVHPKLFDGIGMLNSGPIQLYIDNTGQPVAQRHRRISFHMRSKVEAEINRLLQADIIEPATIVQSTKYNSSF